MQAVVVGSYTTPSRQGAVTFPSTDLDNEMRGCAAFENQVTLQNAATSCIFNSIFPLGSLVMNGGTLVLQKNCFIQSSANFTNSGTIIGNNYQVSLVSTATAMSLPSTDNVISVLTLVGSGSAGAVVNCVDWSYDNQYVAVGTNAQAGKELRIYSFSGTQLTLVASAEISLNVYSVRWHPSSYFLTVSLDEDQNGPDMYVYKFTPGANTLQSTAGGALAGASYANAWHPSGNLFVASSTKANRELILFIQSNGILNNSAGNFTYDIAPDRTVQTNAMAWDPTGGWLAVGVSALSGYNDVLIFSYNNTALTLQFGITIGQTIKSLDWSPSSSHLAVGITGGTQCLRIYAVNTTAQTLTEVTTARIGETQDVLAVCWSPDNKYLAIGRNAGVGTELRIYQFNATAGTLTLVNSLDSAASINSVAWTSDGIHLVYGDTSNNVRVYKTRELTSGVFTMNNTVLNFATDLKLTTGLKIQGTCCLNGTGNSTLSFSEMGCLTVGSGATLTLKNLSLLGMTNGRLICADSTSQVILNDVVWQQDSATSFTQGRLKIMGDVYMIGSSEFTYQSNQILYVDALSTWHFLSDMTFGYAPSTPSKTLLSLMDRTSTLHFVDAGLYVSNVGLTLTKGTLIAEGTMSVTSDGTSSSQAIEFGDGAMVSNNLNLIVKAGAGQQVLSGYVINNNV